jgi:hypothetical protein
MKYLPFALVAWLTLPVAVSAQVVVNPTTAAVDFFSSDHSAVIPVGQANAGQPVIASYQGMVFPEAADPGAGTPTIVGPVVAKATATAGNPGLLRLTLAQMGLTAIPACTVVAPATCPQFTVVMVSIGPGGTSARSVTAESDPFMRAALLPSQAPAGPSQLKVVP